MMNIAFPAWLPGNVYTLGGEQGIPEPEAQTLGQPVNLRLDVIAIQFDQHHRLLPESWMVAQLLS